MNNDVLNSIINIDTVVQEADVNVLDALMNVIDKNDMIQEWSDSEDFSELFMESMMWFTEAVSKDKDEITKWMAKKGYWYNGDNPKKKKECNRMYQFLKQHDFRPSDETYKSDITDGNGGKKRVKLNIDPNRITKDDSEFLNAVRNKDDKELTREEQTRRNVLEDRKSLDAQVRAGKNAFYSHKDDSITMGSKELKGKQRISQFTLKHEEGHAESDSRGIANEHLPEDHPANQALAEHKAAGKYVNSHDDSTEELMADLYAAIHGSIRTKNWGKNKTARNISAADIQKHFNSSIHKSKKDIEKIISKTEKVLSYDKDIIRENVDKILNRCEKYYDEEYINEKLEKPRRHSKGDKKEDKKLNFEELCEEIADDVVGDLIGIIGDDSLDNGLSTYGWVEVSRSDTNKYADREDRDYISEDKKQIKQIKKFYDNIIKTYKDHGLDTIEDVKRYIRTNLVSAGPKNDRGLYKSMLSIIFIASRNIGGIIELVDQYLSEAKNHLSRTIKDMQDFNKGDPRLKRIVKLVHDYMKTYFKTFKFSPEIRKRMTGELLFIVNTELKNKRVLDSHNEVSADNIRKQLEETYGLRIKFAQTAVKEYFEELINDYYFAE